MEANTFSIPVLRNSLEYLAITTWWGTMLGLESSGLLTHFWQHSMVVLGCWLKTGLFGAENLKQLFDAARMNLPHHHFLMLMGINMTQMVLSFAFDFHLLYNINPASFAGIGQDVAAWEALFDFFYLSTLNFSFFGYSDILPQTVPAKIVNLTEIVLAFVTVIFLLSDFISLKASIRNEDRP